MKSSTGGALEGVRELSSTPCPSMGVGAFPEAELLGSCGWEAADTEPDSLRFSERKGS